jgi:uncharacterized protein YjbI with pentapeptide repeats
VTDLAKAPGILAQLRHAERACYNWGMTNAIPAFAIVRPRVLVTRTGEVRPLDEVVEELADEYVSGVVRLCGGFGSGKSTALAHVAAVFAHNEDIAFLDSPTTEQLEACSGDTLTIATALTGGSSFELLLQPWGLDELIEYLLNKHHDACGSVVERLGSGANTRWVPEVACVVLDEFAADGSLTNPNDALLRYVYARIPEGRQRLAAEQYCALMLGTNTVELVDAGRMLQKCGVADEVRPLLRHSIVQLPLATRLVAHEIEKGSTKELERGLSPALIEMVGAACTNREAALSKLRKTLGSRWTQKAHAMAASILLAADPQWRPESPRRPWRFSGGSFCRANWSEVNLFHADLDHSDFTDANLIGANMEGAHAFYAIFSHAKLAGATMPRIAGCSAMFAGTNMNGADLANARLDGADFRNANMAGAILTQANFSKADLSEAQLTGANLQRAKLLLANVENADFTGANLKDAQLSALDLRSATFTGAWFTNAKLRWVQWEYARVDSPQCEGADFTGAHLTGTWFPNGNFRNADLRGAGLAEINWERADLFGADLRSATFHMGSSRSGLVDSTIACEGSKTGFYTDDFEDRTFKRPEEIRKANLCNADLRSVKAKGVDFYLVDLRGAKLDAALREQALATGAILEDTDV